jgi:hypothetical protein
LRGQHAAGDARGVASILCAVRVIDSIIEVALRIDECDVSRDAAGRDATFVVHLCAPEPGGGSPVDGSDEEVVTQADDPDRGRFPQRAIRSDGRDLQFV